MSTYRRKNNGEFNRYLAMLEGDLKAQQEETVQHQQAQQDSTTQQEANVALFFETCAKAHRRSAVSDSRCRTSSCSGGAGSALETLRSGFICFVEQAFVGCGPPPFAVRICPPLAAGKFTRLAPPCTAHRAGHSQFLFRSKRYAGYDATILSASCLVRDGALVNVRPSINPATVSRCCAASLLSLIVQMRATRQQCQRRVIS
jgi:hypothetical protein